MARIHIIGTDGDERVVDGETGCSVMQAALDADIAGIEGQCGGFLNCATCHVIVDEAWRDSLPSRSEEEEELLEGTAEPAGPGSRLSCQIMVTDALDGLRVQLPRRQS